MAKAKKVQAKLPSKPSELIRVALKDLRKAERSKKYVIDMGTWHEPHGDWEFNPDKGYDEYVPNGKCTVCLAGSVIAGTLGVSPKKDAEPLDFGAKTRAALRALNYFREGSIDSAFAALRISEAKQQAAREALDLLGFYYEETFYDEAAPDAFHVRLGAIAGVLESVGL